MKRLFQRLAASSWREKQIDGQQIAHRRVEITVEREFGAASDVQAGPDAGDAEHCGRCGQLLARCPAHEIDGLAGELPGGPATTMALLNLKDEV